MSELSHRNASLYLSTQHIQLAEGGTFSSTLTDLDNSAGSFQTYGQVITFKR